LNPATIVVVEDESIIARDITQTLCALGYDVVGGAPTGEEAILLAGKLRPDLLVMDIHLAGIMDGIESAQVIRARFGTPVVFLSAFAETDTLARAQLVEPRGYIIKPFDDRQLGITIESALGERAAGTRRVPSRAVSSM
jgi:DNA-binding NarL/FixJ family response regulator